MFRRYPYWGWLLFSLLLWCINGYQYHMHRQAMLPARMAHLVNNDLHHRQEAFERFLSDPELLVRMYRGTLSEKEFERISDLPFYIYCYDDDTLVSWNTNTVIADIDSVFINKGILRNEKGVFLERSLTPFAADTDKKVIILFPVLTKYPLENNYLHSRFVASDDIPVKTKIVSPEEATPGAYPVTQDGTVPAFYLQFNIKELQKWVPDPLFIALLLAALLASVSWIQLMIIYVTRKTTPRIGLLLTICTISVLLALYYNCKLPFNLDTLTFFDSRLYATNSLLSSFSDICVTTVCLLWLVIFIARHTPYKTFFKRLKPKPLRFLTASVLILALLCYVNLFVWVIHSLVLNSTISFEVSHFYSINFYSILGLVIIAGITGISCLIIFICNHLLDSLLENKLVKYLLVVAAGSALLICYGYLHDAGSPYTPFDWYLYWAILGWLLCFIVLLDMPRITLVSDLFKPQMVVWAIYICLFCTGLLQNFNQAKERESRKTYVKSRLSPQRDYELEISFDKKAGNMEKDKFLKNFFYKPSAPLRKIIDQHFNTQYLADASLSKYQPMVYLFDSAGRNLFNKDTASFFDLLDLKDESDPTNSSYLFYKEPLHDQHFYLSYTQVYNDTVNKVIGYVIIDLDLKKQISGTVYPELLQTDDKVSGHDEEYSVGFYVNDRLNNQTNIYPFPTYLKNDTLKKEDESAYYNISELYYKISDKRTLVVVRNHILFIEVITLFSYLFVILVLLAIVILLYQLYLSYFSSTPSAKKLMRLTLRRRVHFSMLALVLLSFVIIGFATISFFKNKYQTTNEEKLQSALQVAKQAINDDLKKEHAYGSSYMFDTVTRSSRFKAIITGIANSQKIDLNIYNRKGILVNTSEDDIYEKGLLSRIMRPDAFFKFNELANSILIQDEKIAGLSYLSAYLPLRDDQGVTTGYINVPFFSSEKDLNFQLSNIVVTLINIYAFIFLLSSIVTVFLTRWITQSFNLITQQFARLNLQQNERIKWQYDDEIGVLVNEYNKMVNKVEENAARLAQSERESAWREMARQVAHEIKNPLTPMKLNIQFLQQAMSNDNPNIKELTARVSGSIIEQIDNLSYIASEFSNFAKMPEARPEVLELGELLHTAVKLYLNEDHLTVTLHNPEKLRVYSDYSQLLRVFTNLLENAKQAIPAERDGIIQASIQKEKNEALIIIKDNGAGITADAAERIFQPYFTTKSSGTGLGLAMTRKIIEFWKGKIWFETIDGEGTSFFIRLPLHQ
jgi:two-component system nitrogen regulation sensor histidine kinase NtrY